MPDLRILLTERPDLVLTIDDDFIGSAYSPMVEVTEIEGGHEVSITSKGASGIKTDTFDVINGVDGVSPTVSIESTTEEHTVTITDRDGEHEYTVYTYAAQEAARAAAESQRVAAEQARVTAESSRASAETDRETAWATISAQVTSATQAATSAAQNASQAASDASDAAGHASDVATSAAAAERERVTTEATRADAETARANAESARASAETARATAESARATAESQRASAETSRQSAEQGRASAETARVTAETARVSAETARATEWAEIESDAQSVINAAESAASDATAAAAEARAASAATWLSGNVLFGELAEGAVLTADDVYTAPPKGVEVYGKSTQVTTTGKNLWDEVWENGRIDTSTGEDVYGPAYIRSKNYIPVTPSTTYYCKVGSNSSYWLAIETYDANKGFIRNLGSILNGATFVAPDNCQYVRFYVSDGYGTTYKNDICVNVSDATFNGTYEPYTGGKPAPSPDYPQPIESVDDLTLVITGKNLFDYPTEPFTNTTASVYNGYYFSGGFRSIPNGVDTITASMYIDNSAATDASSLTVWAHNSNGAVVVIGGALIGAGNTGRVSKTYDVSNYSDFALGGLIRPNASVSQLMAELGTTATAYVPYIGQSVSIPLSNHIARSLPDGTRDTLTLSYIGPSTEHEGWGVFGKTLTQYVGESDMGDLAWELGSMTNDGTGRTLYSFSLKNIASKSIHTLRCSGYKYIEPVNPWERCTYGDIFMTTSPTVIVAADPSYDSAAAFTTDSAGVKLQYALATPQTHDLGTVELPILPNPLTAWADGGSAQPTLSMSYEQDINIVIGELRSAIADMVTS